MSKELTEMQIRILGCLIEKEITTPEQYPLSLNGLTAACNQKSNREPVLNLSEQEVQTTLDELIQLHHVVEDNGARVVKYKHRFCNTEYGKLKLSDQELGILCVMFVRGAQTPGELRTRTQRLCRFNDVNDVEKVLQNMAARDEGALVRQLPREPGKRENRWMHLFSGDDIPAAITANTTAPSSPSEDLGAEVARLREEVQELRELVEMMMEEKGQG
ncbi:YceH family protein [Gynuella sp.]|uniref:YceH family protein n=1 Tax=Gynuella sp. TaxID=2969146 RepID=UPI003D09F259